MPTPNVVTLVAVLAAIDAAMTTPYSLGARYRASKSVPRRPTALVPTLAASVQAAPLTARCRRVGAVVRITPATCRIDPPDLRRGRSHRFGFPHRLLDLQPVTPDCPARASTWLGTARARRPRPASAPTTESRRNQRRPSQGQSIADRS